jgi:hypothetical protein
MAKRRGPPSQGLKTFLRNHADGIAAIDLFVVPTISFRLLWFVDHGACRTTGPMVRSSNASDRGMDCKPAHGLRMGAASAVIVGNLIRLASEVESGDAPG